MRRTSTIMLATVGLLWSTTSFFSDPQLAKAVEPLCPGGSSPRSDIVLCEDWETYNPITNASFPDNEDSTFHGWTAGNMGRADGHGYIQSTLKHAGTYALRQQREANGNFVADIEHALTSQTDFRMRFYVYFQSPYGGMGLNGNEANQHLLFLNTAQSFTGVRFDIWAYINDGSGVDPWPPTCGASPRSPRNSEAHMTVSSHDAVKKGITLNQPANCYTIQDHYNEWIMVEWTWKYISSSEARASLWINGTQMMLNEHMGAPDSSSRSITKLIVSGFMSNSTSTEANVYFDDIVVSNNSALTIGPSTGSTGDLVPPAAPQNVRIQ